MTETPVLSLADAKVDMSEIFETKDVIAKRQDAAACWFRTLRDNICSNFETLEEDADGTPLGHQQAGRFSRKEWSREGGGGGEISIMHGRVFEKVGVNISVVHGTFSQEFRKQIPGTDDEGNFWAGGISLVTHPQNPFVPAAHRAPHSHDSSASDSSHERLCWLMPAQGLF